MLSVEKTHRLEGVGRLGDPQLAAVEEPRVLITEDQSEVRWWVELGTPAGLRE